MTYLKHNVATHRGFYFARCLSMIVACVMLASCSALSKVKDFVFPESQLATFSIYASNDVNGGGYPVALDLVAISDQQAFDVLSKLRATEWFAGRTDYLRQYQQKVMLMSWEVVPNQQFVNIGLPSQDNLLGVLVFADYAGDASYRATIVGNKDVAIQLRKDDFIVVPQ